MKRAIWTVAASLAVATAAQAATITTPMLERAPGAQFLCFVVNTGKKPVDITMVMRGNDGLLLAGPLARTTAPGAGSILSITSPGGGAVFGYCAVEGRFSRRNLRVSMCTRPAGTFDCAGTVVGQ